MKKPCLGRYGIKSDIDSMKFSVCIPNYNYEKFLGRTIESALNQRDVDLEIVVSDNASTDRSTEIVRGFADQRIQLHVNRCNVGFAANLDRAAQMAQGDWMLMLSSDDLMRPDALATYGALFERLGAAAERTVATSDMDVIDADDRSNGRTGLPKNQVWQQSDRAPELDSLVGAPVYRVAARELLRRCLLTMQNPFQFAATIYPRSLYNAVEGYGGSRHMNPDKWFHWKLLAKANDAYYIDRPLFAYRWHANNQTAQQAESGALKYLMDEYAATFEIDGGLLKELGLERTAIERAFVEHDIGRHGLAELAKGRRVRAKRIYRFGMAAYTQHCRRNWKVRSLGVLSSLGPLGAAIAQAFYNQARRRAAPPSEALPN